MHIYAHDNVNNQFPKILQKITIIILFTVNLCKVRIFKKSTLFSTSFQLFCDLLSQKIEDRIDEKIHRAIPPKALLKGISNGVANCLLGRARPVPPPPPSPRRVLCLAWLFHPFFLRWIATRQAEGASEIEVPSALGFQ